MKAKLTFRISSVILVLLCLGFCQNLLAQNRLLSQFKQVQKLVDEAQLFIGDAGNEIQFSDGATTAEDVHYHCFDALTFVDSADIKLQLVQYELTDLVFDAKKSQSDAAISSLLKAEQLIKQASTSNTTSKKYLSAILDEKNSTALNQLLFDAVNSINQTINATNQAHTQLKTAVKYLR